MERLYTPRDQRHFASVNEFGYITNVIICDDPAVAEELGHPLEITGTHLGIGKHKDTPAPESA